MKLPDRLLPIKCADKSNHERWTKGRNMLDFPSPFRAVLVAPPNMGKTAVCKNIILRARPEFQAITIIHCDPEGTREYDNLGTDGVEIIGHIPAPDEWPNDGLKRLVILDDVEVKMLPKEQHRNLDRLFGSISTHKFISVMLTSQDAFNIPAICRRCASLVVMWRLPDMDSMATLARKSGITPVKLKRIFSSFKDQRDSLWLDRTEGSPFKLRKNGYQLLKER
jgi:hypothetical protein